LAERRAAARSLEGLDWISRARWRGLAPFFGSECSTHEEIAIDRVGAAAMLLGVLSWGALASLLAG